MGTESATMLRDGRTLSYGEWGRRDGALVFAFHGSGLSRLQHYGDQVPAQAGVRLILPDRPGCGRSDPNPGGTLQSWAADIEQLADALGGGAFSVFGVSAGGPFALACAHALPGRVLTAGLVSAVGGPYLEEPEMAALLRPALRKLIRLALEDPAAAASEAARQCAEEAAAAARSPEELLGSWPAGTPESDRQLMADPEILGRFAAAMAETATRGSDGTLLDALLTYVRPWGFRPADIAVPVYIWHGGRDPFVPVGIARAMAARVPRSTLVEYPGEGHSVDYHHLAEILSALAPR